MPLSQAEKQLIELLARRAFESLRSERPVVPEPGKQMSDFEHFEDCELCGRRFRFGAHIYDGKHVARYNVTVCRECYYENAGGWKPSVESRVTAKLREAGKPIPERNAQGLLPRD